MVVDRPDLAPGSEYHLTLSKTPTRMSDEHDPAIWPDDLVDWDSPNDPANPRYAWQQLECDLQGRARADMLYRNWLLRKKVIVTVQLGITTMGASFASSSFSPAFGAIEQVFGISRTVATLSLSLFVLGSVKRPGLTRVR